MTRPPGPAALRALQVDAPLARDLAHVGRGHDASRLGARRVGAGSPGYDVRSRTLTTGGACAAREARRRRRARPVAGVAVGLAARPASLSRSGRGVRGRGWRGVAGAGLRRAARRRRGAAACPASADTSSPGAPMMATGCPSFTCAPGGTRIFSSVPLSKTRNSIVALSVSTSARRSSTRDRVALLLVPRRRARPLPSWATASASRGSSPWRPQASPLRASRALARSRRRARRCGMHALLELRVVRHRGRRASSRAGWARRARRRRGAARGRRSRRRRRRRASPRARRRSGACFSTLATSVSSSSGRRLRRSTTSAEMPSFSSAAAASSATCVMRE